MKILEPLKIGKLILKNRIMFPPLTTGYEERMVQLVIIHLISMLIWQRVELDML